jgi:hypothetical protein
VLLRLASFGVTNAFAMLRLLAMSDRDKDVEILVLRHQITVLDRRLGKKRVRFADNQTPPPSEKERGQLLRALSSDAIRGSLERHFGIALAFQNCHRVAAFHPEARGGETRTRFTSLRAQILNQSPEFRDC